MYDSVEEYNYRKQIFESNLNFVEDFNSRNDHLKLKVNRFADITDEEYSKMLNSESSLKGFESLNVPKLSENLKRKDAVDWST